MRLLHSSPFNRYFRLSNAFVLFVLLYSYFSLSPAFADGIESLGHSKQQATQLVELGKKLFFDQALSQDQNISCASCHKPELSFTDGKMVSEGTQGKRGTRNAPSLLNASLTKTKFWDGRKSSLSEQVLEPLVNPREHGLKDHAQLILKIQSEKSYSLLFEKAFGRIVSQATPVDIAQALSAYVLSLEPQVTRLSQYLLNNDIASLNEIERQGLQLFQGRAECSNCHHLDKSLSLSDGDYHVRGVGLNKVSGKLPGLIKKISIMAKQERENEIGNNAEVAALGRFVVTLNPLDIGKFKTPSLYQVAMTAPYMHDGSIPTLEAAVNWEIYYRGQDKKTSIVLSQSERDSLIAFLKALTIHG